MSVDDCFEHLHFGLLFLVRLYISKAFNIISLY